MSKIKIDIGIDIGVAQIKFAEITAGRINRIVTENMPDNLVNGDSIVSPEAMSQFIRETVKKNKIKGKSCAVVLSSGLVFTRKITSPYMSIEHLKLNLPYEFRDFITQDKENYFYDYALIGVKNNEAGAPESMELMIAAVLKSTIADYSAIMSRAGLKLKAAMPPEFAYKNIIDLFKVNAFRAPEAPIAPIAPEAAMAPVAVPETIPDSGMAFPDEFCLIDLGHSASRVYLYSGGALEATKIISFGGNTLDMVIADASRVDEHIAHSYKLTNYNDVLDLPQCVDIYSQIAIDISRAVNFYNFNNPSSNLRDAYLFGGGCCIPQLTDRIGEAINLRMHRIYDLLPGAFNKNGSDSGIMLSPAAFGVTLT